jgi:hypothetical protein
MPNQTIHFDPAGGALSVRVESGFAQPGSYALLVLEHDESTIVQQFRANFGSAAQNTHRIPGSAGENDGRVLDLIASVGLLPPTNAFAVHLTVVQNGSDLATVSDTGTGSGLTHVSQLVAALSGAPAVMAVNRSLGAVVVAARRGRRAPSRAARRRAVDAAAKAAVRKSRSRKKSGGPKKRTRRRPR